MMVFPNKSRKQVNIIGIYDIQINKLFANVSICFLKMQEKKVLLQGVILKILFKD